MKNMIVVIGVLILGSCTMFSTLSKGKKISRPFEYSGYSTEKFNDYKRTSQYVAMDDGTKLALDVFLPTEGPEIKSFPVLFAFTVYGRSFVHPNLNWFKKIMASMFMGMRDDVFVLPFQFDKRLLQNGYVLVVADIRGAGASYGARIPSMSKIGEDGAQLVDWISTQPWCNGNVGMFGQSYLSIAQLMTAAQQPKALKCIYPKVTPAQGYNNISPGGIYAQGFMEPYSEYLTGLNLNKLDMNNKIQGKRMSSVPCSPVLDEDGDGDLTDEIPIDKNGNGLFIDDYSYPENPLDPPQYRDGVTRKHIYYLAVREHLENIPPHDFFKAATYIDTKLKDMDLKLKNKKETARLAGYDEDVAENMTSYDISAMAGLDKIAESGIPILTLTHLMDAYSRTHIKLFKTLQKTNPVKLILGAGYHMGDGPFWEYSGEDHKAFKKQEFTEMLRFYDFYLKGFDNGYDKDPSVMVHMVRKGWVSGETWPVQDQKISQYYFSDGNTLSQTPRGNGVDNYKTIFSHNSRYGTNKSNRFLVLVTPDQLPIRTQKDKQCLTYTSKTLNEDIEVMGHPIVEFWASSTADYGDFFVFLEDVDEDGEAILLSEGSLRAGFTKLRDDNMQINQGKTKLDVLPDLPWHGFEAKHYVDKIFADGDIVPLKMDLYPTAWVFKKGHSIRVSIACADWPTFQLHPKLSPKNNPEAESNVTPTITVFRNSAFPSNIKLPLVR